MPSENNRRIAKNTFLLYFRMLLTMLVSLFTVRVILETLGVVDYGIYNVVSGVVVMFSFLSRTMGSASQRFFAFELGRGDFVQLQRTFSLTVLIYFIISIVVIFFAETIGLWFLNTQMEIPPDRIKAANWVYQFSVFSFIITILTIPYHAVIIARENMAVYAYMSILEVVLKLVIVYLLVLFSFDKLKLYAVLMLVTTCIITFIYRIVTRRKYEESQFIYYWDRDLFKTLMDYSGWNLFGAVAGVLNNHGVNILLNIFFGPIVNAARAIAYQVNSAVNQFVLNFSTAVQPQITKYYATGENERMLDLVFRSSKFSYFLLFLLSMPVLLETNFIFELWLKDTPEYVIIFTRLVIICALVDSLSYSLMTAAQATGKMKQYQLVVGGILLLNLPVSYVFLRLGYPPQVSMYISLVISSLCLLLRLWMLKGMIDLSIQQYFMNVLFIVLFVSFIAYLIPLLLLWKLEDNLLRFVLVGVSGGLSSFITIFYIGLSVHERGFLVSEVKNRVSRNV